MRRCRRLSIGLLSIACLFVLPVFGGIGACHGLNDRAAEVAYGPSSPWLTYESDWFSIRYPEDFAVRPSLPSGEGAFDSVFFDAPDGGASFYVLSPQWGRKAVDIQLEPTREREISVEETETEWGRRIVRTIARTGGDAGRIIEENIEDGGAVYWVTAFEFRDDASRWRYAEAYGRFTASLEQFTD